MGELTEIWCVHLEPPPTTNIGIVKERQSAALLSHWDL